MNMLSAAKEIKIFFANISIIILRISNWMKIIWRAVLQKGGFRTRPYEKTKLFIISLTYSLFLLGRFAGVRHSM
jgi:hypothetical protein